MIPKLNYMFQLNKYVTMDAAKLGNEMRYLNHSQDPNCGAQVVLVNEEHRIVFSTIKDVRKGTELLLDYGAKYWN